MTPTLSTLRDLERRLVEAKEHNSELDAQIMVACGLATEINPKAPHRVRYKHEPDLYLASPPVTFSLDAAVALVEKVLPGAEYTLSTLYGPATAELPLNFGDDLPQRGERKDGNMPLAICLALVRALIAKQEERG